ncbi:MAG: hypothetical protein AAF492_33270, partial [Verrucomicrobiota bacterium]
MNQTPPGIPHLSGRAMTMYFLFGVLLPAFTILLELTTGICGQTFFDPIETVPHLLLVAAGPVINAWVIMSIRRRRTE